MSAITLNCGNCAAFEGEDKKSWWGYCKRNPPSHWLEVERNKTDELIAFRNKAGWPQVSKDNWCMQWSAIGHKPLGLGDGR